MNAIKFRLKQNGLKATALCSIGLLSSVSAMAADGSIEGMFGENDGTVFWLLVGAMAALVLVNVFLIGAMKRLASNHDLWKRIMNKGAGAVVIGLFLSSQTVQAADGGSSSWIVLEPATFYTLLAINVTLFGLMLFLISLFKTMLNTIAGKPVEEEVMDEEGIVEVLADRLIDIVPMEEEHTILMNHSYDGIQELDNNLPPWWKYGFYISIVWAVGYLVYFHVSKVGDLQVAEYQVEMEAAAVEHEAYLARAKNLVDENSVVQLTTETALANGQKFFNQNCAACHGKSGEGNAIGPNLTDEYWLHGGSVNDVFTTVKYGVPEKGMQSWKNEMSPGLMQDVVSYVLSFQGTNPPNGKAPQGELYQP